MERSSRRLVIEHVGSTAVRGLEGKGEKTILLFVYSLRN